MKAKNINTDLENCIKIRVLTTTDGTKPTTSRITTRELMSQLAVTTPATLKLTKTTSKREDIQDLKKEILDLKNLVNNKHQDTNLIRIVTGSIVAILILILGVGWMVKKYCTQLDDTDECDYDYQEPGGQIPLQERNM